jgi:hypothetical protein
LRLGTRLGLRGLGFGLLSASHQTLPPLRWPRNPLDLWLRSWLGCRLGGCLLSRGCWLLGHERNSRRVCQLEAGCVRRPDRRELGWCGG